MIVKESVNTNFERTKDPLESMELGLKPQIVALRNELSKLYDKAMNTPSQTYTAEAFFQGRAEGFEEAIGLIDKLPIMKK